MRITETCCCGASIDLAWSQPKSTYDGMGRIEAERASKELSAFRKRHRTCAVAVSPGEQT